MQIWWKKVVNESFSLYNSLLMIEELQLMGLHCNEAILNKPAATNAIQKLLEIGL